MLPRSVKERRHQFEDYISQHPAGPGLTGWLRWCPTGVGQRADGVVQDEQVLVLVLPEGEHQRVQDETQVGYQLRTRLLLQCGERTEGGGERGVSQGPSHNTHTPYSTLFTIPTPPTLPLSQYPHPLLYPSLNTHTPYCNPHNTHTPTVPLSQYRHPLLYPSHNTHTPYCTPSHNTHTPYCTPHTIPTPPTVPLTQYPHPYCNPSLNTNTPTVPLSQYPHPLQ